MLIAAELHDLPEGSESGDSETATEVEVILIFFYEELDKMLYPNRWQKRPPNSKLIQRVAIR